MTVGPVGPGSVQATNIRPSVPAANDGYEIDFFAPGTTTGKDTAPESLASAA
jgi:hypothetical protein